MLCFFQEPLSGRIFIALRAYSCSRYRRAQGAQLQWKYSQHYLSFLSQDERQINCEYFSMIVFSSNYDESRNIFRYTQYLILILLPPGKGDYQIKMTGLLAGNFRTLLERYQNLVLWTWLLLSYFWAEYLKKKKNAIILTAVI